MLYLVSSFHRSGSSMMMRCLEAGGLKAVYDASLDAQLSIGSEKGYDPNPNGYYHNQIQVSEKYFEFYDGKLLKVRFQDILNLPKGEYTIIFMSRDSEEIKRSMLRMFNGTIWTTGAEFIVKDKILETLKSRKDIKIVEVNYFDVIKNPRSVFEKLEEEGLPLNIEKSSAVVDPTLYRNKKN